MALEFEPHKLYAPTATPSKVLRGRPVVLFVVRVVRMWRSSRLVRKSVAERVEECGHDTLRKRPFAT